MASQAAEEVKGKRKVKGKTLDLNTFLGEDQDAPSGFAVVNTRRIDWGDAMENEDLDDRYTMDFKKDDKVVLPTAPKAARGSDADLTKVPTRPPYTAFLGNLPYDVSEEDISQFFRQLKVTNVRLPRENGDKNGRIKGFGYAEFQDRQDLIQALALNNETMKSRAIKVSLAGEHDGDRDRRGGSDGGPDRTLGDWRSGGSARDEPPRNDSYQSNRGFSDRDRGRSNFGDKDYSNFSRGDRFERNERNGDRFDRNDSFRNDRDFGRDQDRRSQDSRGYGFSSDRDMGQRGMGSGGRMERRDGGGGGRDYGSNFGRREDSSRDSRYTDSSDRYPPSSRDTFERRDNRPSYDQGAGGPKERPKLQLAPRTKPIEPTPPPSEATASSIFGGAKPVDTAAREREIEERLERERDAPSTVRDREPPKERSEEARTRRFSTGSGVSNRSRRSSDSGPPEYDECVPQHKPPPAATRQMDADKEQHSNLSRSSRQRCSSNSSTGSDNPSHSKAAQLPPPSTRKDINNANYYPKGTSSDEAPGGADTEAGYRSVRHNHSHRDGSNERVNRGVTLEEPKPPVYTSTNKFSHLMADAEDLDRGSGSE